MGLIGESVLIDAKLIQQMIKFVVLGLPLRHANYEFNTISNKIAGLIENEQCKFIWLI